MLVVKNLRKGKKKKLKWKNKFIKKTPFTRKFCKGKYG